MQLIVDILVPTKNERRNKRISNEEFLLVYQFVMEAN
jgi:hypothetical protein